MAEEINATTIGEIVAIEETGQGRFQRAAHVGNSRFLIDEPVTAGGLGTGPNPYDLLGTALGACTSMTVRLYATRKAWPLSAVHVRVRHSRSGLGGRDVFDIELALEGTLDETQRKKLIEIAERCPVHLTLTRGADVNTNLLPAGKAMPAQTCDTNVHKDNMEEACSEGGGF